MDIVPNRWDVIQTHERDLKDTLNKLGSAGVPPNFIHILPSGSVRFIIAYYVPALPPPSSEGSGPGISLQ